MRETINYKRSREYRITESPEETEALHLATGTFVLSVEALVRPRGIKIVELSLLLHEDEPNRTATEKVRDWGIYRPKCDPGGNIVECKRGMSIDRLLRAIRGAHARYGWWDERVLEIVDRVQKVDRAAIKNFGLLVNDVVLLAHAMSLPAKSVLTEIGNSARLHPLLRAEKAAKRTVDAEGNHVLSE